MVKSFHYGLGKILIKQINSPLFLDENGWLKVEVPMDSISKSMRFNMMIRQYQKNQNNIYCLHHRLNCFIQIISFLKNQGDVIIVRLPIHEKLYDVESKIS